MRPLSPRSLTSLAARLQSSTSLRQAAPALRQQAAAPQRSTFQSARSSPVALGLTGGPAPLKLDTPPLRLGAGGALVPALQQQAPAAQPQAPVGVSPEEAFILQFQDATYNPTGPSSSTNCGPASLAMAIAATGNMPPGLTKEQQVDYARALMCPSRSAEYTYVQDANGNAVPQLDRDHEYTGGTMEQDGIAAAGGSPQWGQGWDALDAALENGPVLGNGYTYDGWRAQFPERMGSGDVGHVNAILGKTPDGKYIVADPLHTGGPVEMTREQLAQFFPDTGGEPTFMATGLGAAGTGPATPATPGSAPGTAPQQGAPSGVPSQDLAYDGGVSWQPGVEQLQQQLVSLGYMTQEEMDTGPGYYGPRTRAAVERLQADYGITGDGGAHYGPRTRAALAQAQEARGSAPAPVEETTGVGGIQLSPEDAETARRVDALLASYPDSQRMHGMGAVLVDACRKEGVPLDLVLAQLGKESTFLRSDNTVSIANNNPGNLRFAEWERQFGGEPGTGGFTHFPSVEQGIRAYVHLLGSPELPYRDMVDRRDWASLVALYAPASDGNDVEEYTRQMYEWTEYFAQKVGIDERWVEQG